ncbi:hypothetical protein H6761_02055 [Candidatus Nomurabacteria bacterium]|nr:hypothetical protein [Candidatus Nomurabacteria bacterium]
MFNQLKLQLVRFQTLFSYKFGDWRKVRIIENNDLLVEIPSEMRYSYYCHSMHLTTDHRIFIRSSVLDRFLKARSILLDQGFDLIVYDGWRSYELQEKLFWYYMREFTADKFNLSAGFSGLVDCDDVRNYFFTLPKNVQSAMFDVNRAYVSWPSKDSMVPSPHATGGSIDVWPFRDGVAVDLGVPFDWMKEDAGTFYHLKARRKAFSDNDAMVIKNRSCLILAMVKAGFSCYGPEIWHFNYGNQMDGLVKHCDAFYSYTEP